jgi:DUF1365 family protein
VRSAIYEGWVRHRRDSPVRHAFTYRVFYLWLDLAELDRVFRGRWLWSVGRPNLVSFRREDYLGDPALPLDEAVRRLVAERTGRRPAGPVRVLTLPRILGFVFNPVTFYYCYDAEDRRPETVVAEITNTPWKERHAYCLSAPADGGGGRARRWRFRKEFHVSPFIDMDAEYDWRFTDPGERLVVHMEDLDARGRFFDATLAAVRRPIGGRALASVLARFPLLTFSVAAGIYLQALRLRMKGAPFFAHPSKRPGTPAAPSPAPAREAAR